jgi:hypothetical protein
VFCLSLVCLAVMSAIGFNITAIHFVFLFVLTGFIFEKIKYRKINDATYYIHKRQYSEALRIGELLVQRHPKDWKSYLVRAWAHKEMQNYTVALADCNQSLTFQDVGLKVFIGPHRPCSLLSRRRKSRRMPQRTQLDS